MCRDKARRGSNAEIFSAKLARHVARTVGVSEECGRRQQLVTAVAPAVVASVSLGKALPMAMSQGRRVSSPWAWTSPRP